ncbi:DUF1365 domain-containing protein [Paraburkholderia sp. SUR17]|uniref:DUF1365 domain-containing protein n=1 Tax=Paraburkholderia sp. SUR17 TaxID=3034358 RepID=UPI002407CCFB|nr:DUF1365 domain-containing protein [Paraburkholderia sp. SUR17]WEY37700.1 DUF1365 domain-containing protein [Paraburkholderia sp. SUR17]
MTTAPDCRRHPAAALLTGRVMHARLRPVRHWFHYPALYVSCDLARLAETERWWFGIDRWAPLGLALRDYGPRDGQPLEAWMRARLADAHIPADGEIWLMTIPRLFGYAFNPVSFWFCHDRAGALRALYADVRNTFGSHHGYLLSAPGQAPIANDTVLVCRKTFHVSPFCDVTGHYVFRVRHSGQRLSVAIDYHDADALLLRTALTLHAQPLDGPLALRTLARQPLAIVAVIVRIHWQALRLWLRRVPFYGAHAPSEAAAAHTATLPPHTPEDTPS